MGSIEVSGDDYVSKDSHVQLTDHAKTRINYGELYHRELMKDIGKYCDKYDIDISECYLLVTHINKIDKIITVKLPNDDTGLHRIFDPKDLKCIDNCYIPRPETPPPHPRSYKKKRFKRTRRNNRKRKTRRSSNRK